MEQTMERAGNFLPRVDEGAVVNEVDRRVVSLTAPASSAAEQYRSLYYRLERMRSLRPMKIIALASAMPGEGKTVTAVNLALVAARANLDRRVLLIDADLRRSQVGRILGIRARPGLSELLAGACQVSDVLRRFSSTHLHVIAAGATPDEPTQVLGSPGMKQLLQGLRDRFDEIYLDLPPLLPFADAAILGHQADGVVMIVRANTTPVGAVTQAVEQLGGTPLLGCVLNGVDAGGALSVRSYLRR